MTRISMKSLLSRLIVTLALAFPPLLAVADTLTGKVVKITDGDTVHVLDSSKTTHKIRLAGIDAPEKKQDFGTKSKQYLGSL
jgi:endonuclease YncB( thermonuclease family)